MAMAGSLSPSGVSNGSLLKVRDPVVVDCAETALETMVAGVNEPVEPQFAKIRMVVIARTKVKRDLCSMGPPLTKRRSFGQPPAADVHSFSARKCADLVKRCT
jgi:hypothetical protein